MPSRAAASSRRRVGTIALALLLAAACRSPAEVEAEHGTRVAVIAPAAAEMLEALDLLDRVVAVGEFGPWPTEIAELPVTGGYDAPNVERLLSLEADLVITAASQAGIASHQRLESLGVEVLALDTSTFEGVFASLEAVGRAFDRTTEAERKAQEMRGALGAIADRTAALATRRVLFVVGRDPLYVAGPGSHIDRMIRLAGGENVAHDALSSYQQMSLEAALERLPEVIIDTSDNRPSAVRGREPGPWARWDFLPAVRYDRVYAVDPSLLVIPGIRLPEMTRLVGRLVHPEVFGEPGPADFEPSTEASAP
jgi:iron complex transport system substrate-binding protein